VRNSGCRLNPNLRCRVTSVSGGRRREQIGRCVDHSNYKLSTPLSVTASSWRCIVNAWRR